MTAEARCELRGRGVIRARQYLVAHQTDGPWQPRHCTGRPSHVWSAALCSTGRLERLHLLQSRHRVTAALDCIQTSRHFSGWVDWTGPGQTADSAMPPVTAHNSGQGREIYRRPAPVDTDCTMHRTPCSQAGAIYQDFLTVLTIQKLIWYAALWYSPTLTLQLLSLQLMFAPAEAAACCLPVCETGGCNYMS